MLCRGSYASIHFTISRFRTLSEKFPTEVTSKRHSHNVTWTDPDMHLFLSLRNCQDMIRVTGNLMTYLIQVSTFAICSKKHICLTENAFKEVLLVDHVRGKYYKSNTLGMLYCQRDCKSNRFVSLHHCQRRIDYNANKLASIRNQTS